MSKEQRSELVEALERGFERMAQGRHGYFDRLPPKLIEAIRNAPLLDEKEISNTLDFTRIKALSNRERQILLGVSHGLSLPEVAEIYGISYWTVTSHMKTIRRKLKAKTQAHCVAIALRRELIS